MTDRQKAPLFHGSQSVAPSHGLSPQTSRLSVPALDIVIAICLDYPITTEREELTFKETMNCFSSRSSLLSALFALSCSMISCRLLALLCATGETNPRDLFNICFGRTEKYVLERFDRSRAHCWLVMNKKYERFTTRATTGVPRFDKPISDYRGGRGGVFSKPTLFGYTW